MTPQQRTYLFGQSGVGAAIVNALLNGGLGWLLVRKLPEFGVWTIPGAMSDLVGTAGGVAFGTCVVLAFTVPFDVKRGKVTPPDVSAELRAKIARLPPKTFLRGVFLGMVCAAVFVPPVAIVFLATGTKALSPVAFTWLKTGLAAVVGGLITPYIALAVLLDVEKAAVPARTDGAR